jgi:hypothetical protein
MNIVRGPPQTVGTSVPVGITVAVGVGVNVGVEVGVNINVGVAETTNGVNPLTAAQPRMKKGAKITIRKLGFVKSIGLSILFIEQFYRDKCSK